MSEQFVTATLEDHLVRIRLWDGTEQLIPHQNRAVAALLMNDWVADWARRWSGGRLTARPVEALTANSVPVPTGARTSADRIRDRHLGAFASVGEILAANARVQSTRFSLQPAL